jgi:pimeloyl-ACP methyl ester carboxylesterase
MPGSREAWRSETLGARSQLRLSQCVLPYHDAGSGPPLVFVHGALVNANHWRKVVPQLAPSFRCVTLDLPLGAHLDPLPADADNTPPALAGLIADALDALELEDVTLIGNDTGGALCQLVAAHRPERLGGLVLTSCDAFEHFPPKVMRPLMPLLGMPRALPLLFAPMRLKPARRRLMTLIRATRQPVELEVMDSYAFPALRSRGVRRDIAKLARGIEPELTLAAAERLRSFERPTLIAWSRDDVFFPPSDAERLARQLPNARLEWIEDSYTFSPEDQPARLAELIADLAGTTTPLAQPRESH